MLSPTALANNIRQTFVLCPSWRDRFARLMWLYHAKGLVRLFKRSRLQRIRFCYSPPVNDIEVLVRDNGGSDAFVLGEVFDHRYYDFILSSTPKTILDLGANAGFSAIFFGRKYPEAEIACVEPMPVNVNVLKENLRLNDVRASVFAMAIATFDGRITMQQSTLDYGHKVAAIEYGAALSGALNEVDAISVPTLVAQMGWNRIGLLKVDIEGYEAVLLKENCDWLSLTDVICVECHQGYGDTDLIELAQNYGFEVPRKLPGTWLMVRP